MAGDYINPFAGMENTGSESNPMWAEMIRSENARLRRPFIDQARERGDLELARQRMETGEFLGQEAQGVRSQQRRAEGSEAQYKIDTNPTKAKKDNAAMLEEIRALPYVTDERIAKAKQATEMHKAGPYKELLAELGASYDLMHGKNPDEQAQHYFNALQRWQQTHPDSQLPQQYMRFDPRMIPDLAAIRYGQLHTADQVGRERIVALQGQNQQANTKLENVGRENVATINAAGHLAGVQIAAGSREGENQARARLRKALAKDPNNEEARREYTTYLEEAFEKQKPDSMEQMMAIQGSGGDSKAQQSYRTYREQRRARLYMNEGVYGKIDAEGRNAVLRALQLNPEMGLDNVIEQLKAYKRKDKKNGLGQ